MRRWRHFNKGQHWKFWRMHNSTSQVPHPHFQVSQDDQEWRQKDIRGCGYAPPFDFKTKRQNMFYSLHSLLFFSFPFCTGWGPCRSLFGPTFHKLYVFHYFAIVVFLLFEIQSAGLYPGLPNLTWVSLPADNNILLPGENFRLNRRQIFWGKRKYSSLEREVHPFHILSSPVIYFCNNWSCAILLALHPNNPFKIVLATSFDLEEFQFHF